MYLLTKIAQLTSQKSEIISVLAIDDMAFYHVVKKIKIKISQAIIKIMQPFSYSLFGAAAIKPLFFEKSSPI